MRASSEHSCRCKDIARSEGRRPFSQCVCPDELAVFARMCLHMHVHTRTHTLEFYSCDSCAQPLAICPRVRNLGAVATLSWCVCEAGHFLTVGSLALPVLLAGTACKWVSFLDVTFKSF